MTMKLHKNNIQQFSNNFRFSCAIKSSWENQFHFSIKRRGVENQSEKRNLKNKTNSKDDKFHNDDDGDESDNDDNDDDDDGDDDAE